MAKILSEEKALELTEMLLQNDKEIKETLEGKITQNDVGLTKSALKPSVDGEIGDIVFCSNPAPNDYVGWVFTTFGWLGFGKIENVEIEEDDIPENAMILEDGTAFTLADGTIFLYANN